jgi:hypothetical protein
MSNYNRTTRECPVGELQPELRQAVRKYFREHELGNPETETLLCCETVSTQKDTGWLNTLLAGGEEANIHTAMLLTSEWLVWVRKGDQSETVMTAANLTEVRVKPHLSLINKDRGLDIIAFLRDSKSTIRGYVGMGQGPATEKFCDEVVKAVEKVKPPEPKPFARWFGR